MADTIKRVRKETKKGRKGVDKKSNTQSIRQAKYNKLLLKMQEGSQPYTVLKYLIRKGHTSSLEIETSFSIANPTAVISTLRKYGADISSTKIPAKGNKKPYWKITLEV